MLANIVKAAKLQVLIFLLPCLYCRLNSPSQMPASIQLLSLPPTTQDIYETKSIDQFLIVRHVVSKGFQKQLLDLMCMGTCTCRLPRHQALSRALAGKRTHTHTSVGCVYRCTRMCLFKKMIGNYCFNLTV